jgi:flagellar basal-body rod protein FlgB
MSMLEMPTAQALSRYLSLATEQMKLTAANMANVDTPGYRTVGMDFHGEFEKALDTHGTAPEVTAFAVPDLVTRPDGNNVSVDRESTTMAATQLQFRTGIELLRHEYTRMMDAIKSDGK